jgi:hypothetical protein
MLDKFQKSMKKPPACGAWVGGVERSHAGRSMAAKSLQTWYDSPWMMWEKSTSSIDIIQHAVPT